MHKRDLRRADGGLAEETRAIGVDVTAITSDASLLLGD
jgi:hypothetical protein